MIINKTYIPLFGIAALCMQTCSQPTPPFQSKMAKNWTVPEVGREQSYTPRRDGTKACFIMHGKFEAILIARQRINALK